MKNKLSRTAKIGLFLLALYALIALGLIGYGLERYALVPFIEAGKRGESWVRAVVVLGVLALLMAGHWRC